MPKLEQFPLDSRLRDINLKRGRITKEDIAKHLQSLPDCGGEAEELIIQEEENESPTLSSVAASSEDTPDEVLEEEEESEANI